MSEGDPKFSNAAVRDYATTASINWKIISAYNSRGNAKVERMIRTFKRAVQKVLISNKDQDWDEHLGEVLAGYPRRSGTDGESTFEIQSGIRPRFAIGPPQLDLVAFNTDLAREFEVPVAKLARVSRIVPRATEMWAKINRTEMQERAGFKNRIQKPVQSIHCQRGKSPEVPVSNRWL